MVLTAGKAWQTPLGMLAPVMEGVPVASCAAHAVVLQLPLEGMLQGGGISAVLKRPEGVHPEWLTRDQNRNFFVSFAEVWAAQLVFRSWILGLLLCKKRRLQKGKTETGKMQAIQTDRYDFCTAVTFAAKAHEICAEPGLRAKCIVVAPQPVRRLTEHCSTQVWKLAQDGKVMSASAISAQPTDRYRGPSRARRYEEAKLERRRRQEEKRAAAAQGGPKVACMGTPHAQAPSLHAVLCLAAVA